MFLPPDLKDGESEQGLSPDNQRSSSSTTSSVSMKSDRSMFLPPDLKDGESRQGLSPGKQRSSSPITSSVSMKSDHSHQPPDLKHGDSNGQERPHKETLTEHLKKAMTKQLKKGLKSEKIETELIIKTGQQEDKKKGGENQTGAHKTSSQIKYNEIFNSKGSVEGAGPRVLTVGLAGIGKTFLAEKFMLDWTGGRSKKEIDILFSINLGDFRSNETQSLEKLLDLYLGNAREHRTSDYENYKIAFVLDSLDNCKLTLDFDTQNDLTDTREEASVDRLLTNLIKGNLLPSASLWILTQHSAADRIPPLCINRVTECQDSLTRRQKLTQKMKERFTKEFPDNQDWSHPKKITTEHIVKPCPGNVKAISLVDIFKPEKDETIKSVLTIGEPGIGKTFHAQKFTRDWATQTVSFFKRWFRFNQQDEEMVFNLTSLKLSYFKEEKICFVGLLNYFFKETQESVVSNFEHYNLIIILDGLDVLPLLSNNNVQTISDVTEVAPVNVLLTNLIMGNLLPSARLWILSRPQAAQHIPSEFIQRQTEIREKTANVSQRKLKAHLIKQFQRISEGITQQAKSALLREIYTELYIIEAEGEDVIVQSESRRVQAASFEGVRQETPIKHHDILNSGKHGEVRRVLTNGIAGSGKTVAVQKYILDWAEGAVNQGIYFVFTFPFRQLNLMAAKEHSFEEIINCFFPEMKTSEITNYDNYKILIVLDGFDECRLPLDFGCQSVTDVKKPAPLNILLTNLIKGNLLPEAQLWITARPASSRNIPPEYIDLVTEVRGFNDTQREQYFRKRCSQELAERMISHIKMSRALYIMCYIPVFCWITSTVLEDLLKCSGEDVHMPKTLTDMYICFLLLQCKLSIDKFPVGDETKDDHFLDSCWTEANKKTVLSLGKLAYEELERGNLVFVEEDLKQREMDIKACAVYSGLFTQISQDNYDLVKQNLYSFVHLSIQEFLAAVYAFATFVNTGENVLTKPASTIGAQSASVFYTCAVDKALENPNGDWDMFLRFVLGLSLETNQNPLHGLLGRQAGGHQPETSKDTIEYIKKKLDGEINIDKSINLFHCLNELNDHSLVKDIKDSLQKQSLSCDKFTPSQWSALTYVLLTSDAELDVFDLKQFFPSEKVLLGMLPVVKVSRTALLSWCDLTAKSCEVLASSILSSSSCNLTVLNLSHNDITDAGVVYLAEGLRSKCCRLEVLKLSGCQVTNAGCLSLASALERNHSTLQELDLSYNHPLESGKQRLLAIVADPQTSLKKLSMDHAGECRIKPGLKKYGMELSLDANTASSKLVLSNAGRTARRRKTHDQTQEVADHEKRFVRTQVLCEVELTDLCYWEVEWSSKVGVAVAEDQIERKEWDYHSGFGTNKMSWNLVVEARKRSVKWTAFRGTNTGIGQGCFKLGTMRPRLGVLLDRDGGRLVFYNVSSEKRSHIYTFTGWFKELNLYAGFWLKDGPVTLCKN